MFLQNKTIKKYTWSLQVLKILKDLFGEHIQTEQFMGGIDLIEAKTLLSSKDKEHWNMEVRKFSKLRTYVKLKTICR